MKKIVFLLFVTLIFNSCTQRKSDFSEKLCKKWFVHSITINESEDKENYPTNNDELILNKNGTYLMKDKIFNYHSSGTWLVQEEMELTLKSNEGISIFKIIGLNDSNLITELTNEEGKLRIFYSNKKLE